ncbi:Hypothetical predicted protein [Paramuricea clavata]|uniref:Uncharacterized protein n=1 Tax=Paramuricea clavata TaxID=317549 RepID=A0A6S7G3F6_PARCT|nr:Hypothetical predicted protein [Paramuricea clavata]
MAKYSSKYIRDFATLTAPLRELTKKNARFTWLPKHQACFDKLKATLASAKCMSYFAKDKETQVIVDASPVGILAILSQQEPVTDHKPLEVIYGSRKAKASARIERWILRSGANNPADYLSRHPSTPIHESKRK